MILEFLAAHSYDQPINAKILSKPTNKDYQNLVIFLFRLIDPNYVCTGKIEDEIITMFKFLGYPFNINKSNIAAVGSPHAWPHMLASITWLVELLSYDDAVNSTTAASEANFAAEGDPMHETSASLEKQFYKYLTKSYSFFITRKDLQFQSIEEQFVQSFVHRNNLLGDATDALEQRNQSLDHEISAIKQRALYLPELNSRKGDLLRQVAVLQETVQNKCREADELRDRIATKTQELRGLQGHIQTVKREIHKVKDILSKQEISADDVINMTNERLRLEKTFEQLSEMRVNYNREVYRLELVLRDNLAYLESSVRSYHGIAEDLKLVPMSNKNARGEDYSIEVDLKSKRADQLLKTDIKNHLLMLLSDVRRELQEMTLELRQEVLEEQERIEEQEISRSHLQEELNQHREKLEFLEDIYAKEKANFDQTHTLTNKELYALEHKLLALRDVTVEEARLTSLNRRIGELTASRQTHAIEHAAKKELLIGEIIDAISLCAGHREEVQTTLDDLKTTFAERLQALLQKDELVGALFHFNTVVGVDETRALPLPPAPLRREAVDDLTSGTFRLHSRESLLLPGPPGGGEENDSVRFDDDAALDTRDVSVMSEADQGSLHALMHGL